MIRPGSCSKRKHEQPPARAPHRERLYRRELDSGIDQLSAYATKLSGGSWTVPQEIDNGPGGDVHVVAADSEPSGTGAALFTQLGPDGNSLYGVEDVPAAGSARAACSAHPTRAMKARARFGNVLCTDTYGDVASCVTGLLDSVRATLAAPKAADTSRSTQASSARAR